MFSAETAISLPERQRGPHPFFTGQKLSDLAAYLSEPGSTLDGAAERFGCSTSCVEKTVARIRKAQRGEAA
ncbi:hypothetical protein [Fimbriimonas ginsengisoli]|uniref:hypothetical protein n=1 Tax=Fimbriimonas ginsengisoli TaxID=1005039 RepID=UPI00046CAE92|nr:hypothetical protein [Fimbriimonas ginsengisoli]